jgi:hypothetical protein
MREIDASGLFIVAKARSTYVSNEGIVLRALEGTV